MGRRIYTVGSLRNPRILEVAAALRAAGHEVFDDYMAAGPEADDRWQAYEQSRGFNYAEALQRPAAQNVYQFDRRWLDWAEIGVMVMPAGRSAHREIGRFEGQGKPTYILLAPDDPEPRWDVMNAGSEGVFYDIEDLIAEIGRKA